MLLGIELQPVAADAAAPDDWLALAALRPDWLAVADPPGADNAHSVTQLRRATRTPLLPHLTTRNRTPHDVAERVGAWRGAGVAQLLALRGDATGTCDLSRDQRLRSARELVQLLVALDPELEVWCAGYPETHPEAASADADLHALRAKVAAGAAGIVCQFSFEPEPFLRFRDRVTEAGLDVPLIAGVLPVHDARWLGGFAGQCGATLPPAVAQACERWRDDDAALAAFGVEQACVLVEALRRAGCDGLQFFTRNRAAQTSAIWAALRLPQAARAL